MQSVQNAALFCESQVRLGLCVCRDVSIFEEAIFSLAVSVSFFL